jgi:serine/threonine-protein kinase
LEAGQRIGDFILEKEIGSGGTGEVWRARHQYLGNTVAIKAIHRHISQDSAFRARFLEEASVMAQLEHPHIVSVHNFFFLDGVPYLVMTYIEGGSLADLLQRHGRLPLDEVLAITRGIFEALNFAHSRGVIHRDVKPSNILVRPDKHAYLVDFGIALVMGKQRHTRFGTHIGTPEYMSPEQIRPNGIDHRTDVYSFGCVLYEMLTGRPPFGSQDAGQPEYDIMSDHLYKQPPSLREINHEVDEHIESVVLRALAKDPDQRYGGCQDFAQDLFAGPPPCSKKNSGRGPSSSWCFKRKYIVISFLVIALVFIFKYLLLDLGEKTEPPPNHDSGRVDSSPPPPPDGVQKVLQFMDSFFPKGGDFRINLWPNKSGEAVYVEGENLVVRFESTTDAYVQVDYFQDGGQVFHLQDGSFSRARMGMLLDTSLLPIKVAPPFGQGIVTIIASQTPLLGVTKAPTESASTYLDHLTQYLQGQKTHGKWAGAYFKVFTRSTNTQNVPSREAPAKN